MYIYIYSSNHYIITSFITYYILYVKETMYIYIYTHIYIYVYTYMYIQSVYNVKNWGIQNRAALR